MMKDICSQEILKYSIFPISASILMFGSARVLLSYPFCFLLAGVTLVACLIINSMFLIPGYRKGRAKMVDMLLHCMHMPGGYNGDPVYTDLYPKLKSIKLLCEQIDLIPADLRGEFVNAYFSPLYQALSINKRAIRGNRAPDGLEELLDLSAQEIESAIDRILNERGSLEIELAGNLYEEYKQMGNRRDR